MRMVLTMKVVIKNDSHAKLLYSKANASKATIIPEQMETECVIIRNFVGKKGPIIYLLSLCGKHDVIMTEVFTC